MVQVGKSHYDFKRYFDRGRWMSLYHQVDELVTLGPRSVLEIGPGAGFLGALLERCGIHVDTLDFDPELKPDLVASASELPLRDGAYDCVCAFQMLEHLPYDESMKAFDEMVRVAGRNVVLSLPDMKGGWPVSVHLPRLGMRRILLPKPRFIMKLPKIIDQHYWELGRPEYSREEVLEDFLAREVELVRDYQVHEFPYHHFFIFNKPRL